MSVINYLPEKSKYSTKFAEAVDHYGSSVYVVGSAARKGLYGLKITPSDYNFITTNGGVMDRLRHYFPNKITEGSNPKQFKIDCEVFTATVDMEPVDEFLYSVRFAGDGVAVRVSDGRPIVVPEYMTLPPVVEIQKVGADDSQNNKEWADNHVETLTKFQEELLKVVQSQFDNEPTKS
jgi:hypothetical protein